MRLGRTRRVHFVGVGGVGMCGLAEILLAEGLEVSGSDLAASERTDRLATRGARIAIGHDPSHLGDADLVVVSSAVDAANPELAAARTRSIPIVRRAEMLAELMRLREGVAVAGTHGKTTTTSLTGHLLTAAGLDPTVVVGGRVHLLEAHARLGRGRVMVCEADEFDRSFLALSPVWAVITNIEPEHLECYGDAAGLEAAFAAFAGRVPFWGAVIGCADDPGVRRVLATIDRRSVTYGLSAEAWLHGRVVDAGATGSRVAVDAGGTPLGELFVPLVGVHNVRNALAALAVGLELEIPLVTLTEAMATFSGVARRFEQRGERDGVVVVDDYAHHPTEVAATLAAARQAFPDRRLVAVFQPHLYSRTRDFSTAFGDALLAADVAVVLPIYPAREAPLPGVTAELVADAARRLGHRLVVAPADAAAARVWLDGCLRSGDVLLTLGAGDVWRIGAAWLGGGP